jgi:hypothetical protein
MHNEMSVLVRRDHSRDERLVRVDELDLGLGECRSRRQSYSRTLAAPSPNR